MNIKEARSFREWYQIKRLYKKAFPKYERKPFSVIRAMNRSGASDAWIIEERGRFSGFALTMNDSDLVLLDYFAISDKKRGNGLGGKALQILQEKYADRRFFLEIESVYMEADNLEERCRRKHFYLKNGMTEMNVMAKVWGTEMELLGHNCQVTYDDYYSVYQRNYDKKVSYSSWAPNRLVQVEYPSEK